MPFADWSPLSRRLIAVLLAALVLMLLVNNLVIPVAGVFERQARRIAELETNYARFAQAASGRQALEEQARRLAADTSWRRRLMVAGSEAEAATALQQFVRSTATAAGLQLLSFEPVQTPGAYGFKRPGVRVELQGSSAAFATFLESLHNAQQLLATDNVWLRAQSPGGDQLQIRMELIGYWMGEGAAS